jgi:tRNA modification GTPase
MQQADLILLVLDVVKGLGEEEQWLLQQAPRERTIALWNKCDMPHSTVPVIDFAHVATISAKEGIGLDILQQKIEEVIWQKGPPSKEEVIITNVRHKEALEKAILSCREVMHGLRHNVSPEFVSSDMRSCLNALGSIIGTNITEDILSAIFSKFCIGK